ncbi:MAG: hypothetical protein HQ461_04575 [Deltaproteobacteria bacterium]|nr:hypothetical protein [Deltaproteobacteria bacterium]
MYWSIVVDLAIPVAERAALSVEQLGEPMRHMGIGFAAVPTDRVRLILAAGQLTAEGEMERIDVALTEIAVATRRFTYRLAAPSWHPSEEEARALVARVTEGEEQLAQVRLRLTEELGSELCLTGAEDAGGGAVVLLGTLDEAEHHELRGLLPSSAADLGSSVVSDLAVVRWTETAGGPKWRVSKRYFLQS